MFDVGYFIKRVYRTRTGYIFITPTLVGIYPTITNFTKAVIILSTKFISHFTHPHKTLN